MIHPPGGRYMLAPALIPVLFPIVVGVINERMLGGLLVGTIVTGLFLAISMTSHNRFTP